MHAMNSVNNLARSPKCVGNTVAILLIVVVVPRTAV